MLALRDHVPEVERIRQRADEARRLLEGHGITPSPENYRLCYTHVEGGLPALSNAIREAVAAPGGLTDAICHQLHDQHFGTFLEARRLLDRGQQLLELSRRMHGELGEAGQETRETSAAIDDARSRIEKMSEGQEMISVLGRVLCEIARIQEVVVRTEKRMADGAKEIDVIRRELQVAQNAALIDPLTKLANRRHLDTAMRVISQRARKTGSCASLIMADIDHFKRFNDQYGHAAGDAVLQLVSQALRRHVKGTDVVARYGGEEFVLVLPDTELGAAFALANQLRERIATRQLQQPDRRTAFARVTISMGVAQYRQDETTAAWLARADEALYLAKEGGRNRVIASADG